VIPIARPMVGEEEKEAVLRVLGSGMLAQGAEVKAFEEAFARVCSIGSAIATSETHRQHLGFPADSK
jgi:perosamine synthetase